MKPAGPFVLPSVPVIRPLHNPACAMSGPFGRWSERPIQRLDEDGAGAALVERNGIAAGGRILRRHRGDAVDLRTVDAETRQGVRDAGALPEVEDELEECIEARRKAEIARKARD